MKFTFSNKTLPILLLIIVIFSACGTKKRYNVSGSKRIQTIAELKPNVQQDTLNKTLPPITSTNQKIQLKKTHPNLPLISSKSNLKPANTLASHVGHEFKKIPDERKKPDDILETDNKRNSVWNHEIKILICLYFISILLFSLFLGLYGLLYGFLIFLPLILAAILVYLIGNNLNADYYINVKLNPETEDKYHDLKIATWATFIAFIALLGLFIILVISVLLPIEEGAPLMLGFFFAFHFITILVLLFAFIVLAILYAVKQSRHPKASELNPNINKPYTFWNAPWHCFAILFLAIACFALLSPTAPFISIPFFAGLFMLSLDNRGAFTKYTRLLLLLVSIALCVAYILAFSTYVAPILALIIALCLIFLLKGKTQGIVKRYKSLIKAIGNITIPLMGCILGVIVFLGPDATLPLLSMVSYGLLFSAMMFFLALLVMLIMYLIRPVEIDKV